MRVANGYPTQTKLLEILIKETGQLAQIESGEIINDSVKQLLDQVNLAEH